MVKEEKKTPNEQEKKCHCDSSCTCGCNEGKECTCGCGNGCCCKKGVFKLLALLLVFLAGMGFNELLHGCCGRCPAKGPKPMMGMPHHMQLPKPAYTDDKGNTIIIINTDGSDDNVSKHFSHCQKHHDKFGKHKHHKKYQGAENQPVPSTDVTAE